MTLYEFKQLCINDQAQATWDDGIQIGFRQQEQEHMILYRLDSFYVEVRYHSVKNEVTAIKSFISDEPLQPYLDTIDISSLLW